MSSPAEAPVDVDELPTNRFDPLVPRPIDRPTDLPPGGMLDPAVGDIAKIIAAPDDPDEWPRWRRDLAVWRAEARARLGFDPTFYDDPRTEWTTRCFTVAQVWLWDERLFDRAAHAFTVDRFIEATAAHGGYDGVVLWHAYPVIGIDDRNQFDFYRQVPGLAGVVARFHERGVKVFVDYNPWDTGTRRSSSSDAVELAALVTELGTDGVFLDTMKEGGSALVGALRAATPPQVLEGESRVPNDRISDHQLSWAQWFADSTAPGVMRAHVFEQRHMMHSTRRWNRDHSDELQSAWMNGTGMMVWDAVFGVWVGWSERDSATLRAMLRVQRALAELLVAAEWEPLAGAHGSYAARGVYGSTWRHGALTLTTFVNRSDRPVDGIHPATPRRGRRYDLVAGVEIDDGAIRIDGRGIGAVLDVEHPASDKPKAWLSALLAAAAADRSTDLSAQFPALATVRTPPPVSRLSTPSESVVMLPASERTLELTYRRRETGWYEGAPYVEEWKPLPPRLHDERHETVTVTLGAVAVAVREVSARAFALFRARESADDGGRDAPATGVTLEDARAYAASVGARLPTEFEWQAAADDPGFARREPAVWNWTESEHSDGVTRFSMLKGGSDHLSAGSDWYADGGRRDARWALKYLHLGLGLDASPSIGFRLAWDLDAAPRAEAHR